MKRPSASRDRPEADPDIVERLNGEDPARFLAACERRRVTKTVKSLLKGMQDTERLALWRMVEHQQFGGRAGVVRELDRVGDRLSGDHVEDVPKAEAKVADDGDAHEDSRDRDGGLEEADVHDGGDSPDESDSEDSETQVEREEDFEAAVERAMGIIDGFDLAKCRAQLQDEQDREQSRAHVIEALERRIKKLDGDSPVSAEQSPDAEVSA